MEAKGGCRISWHWRSCELSDVGAWEENSGPPQEQCVLLTTALSLALHLIFDTEPVASQFG